MFLDEIVLENFRIYYAKNTVQFSKDPNHNKNLYLISGSNGFGKTSFITALIWCLYGSRIKYVDDTHRQEINKFGGYKSFAQSNFNRQAQIENEKSYSVSLKFSDFHISSLPYKTLEIIREYDVSNSKETVKILIDNEENELTKDVGPEIFIDEFILPIDIAKFYLFDSEKIVQFAEFNSYEDKRLLSKAYSEILGISKYEQLIETLETVRIKLRKNSATKEQNQKLKLIEEEINDLQMQIELKEKEIQLNANEIDSLTFSRKDYELKILKEGGDSSLDDYSRLIAEKEEVVESVKKIKSHLYEYLEIIPFAIGFNLFRKIQLNKKSVDFSEEDINDLEKDFSKKIRENRLVAELPADSKSAISAEILKLFRESISNSKKNTSKSKMLLSNEESKKLRQIGAFLQNDFRVKVKELSDEYNLRQNEFLQLVRKIITIEKREKDPVIKRYRQKLNEIENNKSVNEDKIKRLQTEIQVTRDMIQAKDRVYIALSKEIELDSNVKEKESFISKLISDLHDYVHKLKAVRKDSLQQSLKSNADLLYHKKNFIGEVIVNLENDILDIQLVDRNGSYLDRNLMSKGEQQIFATIVLKALVEESNFKFPVFIDSPLQKLDFKHSENIIKEFYPSISKQVVILPLLGKELSKNEYTFLSDKLMDTFVIDNISSSASTIKHVDEDNFLSEFVGN
jgi:DNA sulfur modification protein DndD